MQSFGASDPQLAKRVHQLAKQDSLNVKFTPHAEQAMDDDGFDHDQVMTCLKHGTVYGPEIQNNQLRANVIHRGLHIRVVIGGLDTALGDWGKVQKLKVITVMNTN
jgi:hypothetical protein